MEWLNEVWRSARGPLAEIVAHIAIILVYLIGMLVVEGILWLTHYANRQMPLVDTSVSDWFFDMDVVGATAIAARGIYKVFRRV
jgi:hypothetical protein